MRTFNLMLAQRGSRCGCSNMEVECEGSTIRGVINLAAI